MFPMNKTMIATIGT